MSLSDDAQVYRCSARIWPGPAVASVQFMPDEFDIPAMIQRFRERAKAVRSRGMPPVEGADRRRILQQMQLDYQDFAMLGDASGTIEDGVLVLRVDLRPAATKGG